jgi:hypothetical protein
MQPQHLPRLSHLGGKAGAAELRDVVERDRVLPLPRAVLEKRVAVVFDQVHQAAVAIHDNELLLIGPAVKQDFDLRYTTAIFDPHHYDVSPLTIVERCPALVGNGANISYNLFVAYF